MPMLAASQSLSIALLTAMTYSTPAGSVYSSAAHHLALAALVEV